MHLVGCLYYLYQWCTVKQISNNEIYFLIKYIKSLLWRVAKHLSYTEDAWCLKVKWQTWYTELTGLLQFTIKVQKSHHQHQCTLKLECKIMCCLSELIFTLLHVGSSIQNASDQFDSCFHLYFVNSILHPTPQTKI